MLHTGEVAESPVQLGEWITRTEDLHDSLAKAGYGSAFTSEDLFPLFQSYVAKAPHSPKSPTGGRFSRWLWTGIMITVAVAVIAVGVAVAVR
jgi:hypothetical protein